jgi:hypothetical protein
MISALKTFLLTIVLTVLMFAANAQKKDSTFVGAIGGLVKDSVHNYVLRSATVSVYKSDGNQLLGYQLSNNFGKFQFKGLPIGIKLNLMMSYVGYKPYKKEFVIPTDTHELDLKTLIAERADLDLEEVKIVAKPPVEMKGDTLVFNADAFQVDSNATVEDLMRKLTGVTVWSDGLITVNGKKISNLYVEGKPFFGGDPKIALQNLPKKVVDKIQVYEDNNSADKLNPDVNMNIMLKKDKKSGMFGKIGGGYGTDQHYAADGMLNAYTPKTQLGIIGTRNNVNKTANSVSSLMGYSSYKGQGTNYDYQSDFSRRGLNVFSSAGFTLAHEFSKPDRLNADYFFSNSKQEELEKVRTVESQNEGSQLDKNAVGTSNTVRNDHRINTSYRHSSESWELDARYSMNNGTSSGINNQLSDVLNTATGATSRNSARQENTGDQSTVEVELGFENKDKYNSTHKSAPFKAAYSYRNNSGTNFSKRTTEYMASDPSQNRYFNRQYDTDFDNSAHTIIVTVPGIQPVELAYRGINMHIENTINVGNNIEATKVGDLNDAGQYSRIDYLTNKTRYNTLSEKPVIGLSKNFRKYLSNRYEKNMTISLLPGAEIFYHENSAGKVFQQFNEYYFRFLPKVDLRYTHQKNGSFYRVYSLNYNTSAVYPNLYQLAPLTDSANINFLHFGNPDLKPAYRQELSFKFEHSNYSMGGTDMLNFRLNAGKVNRFIGDSSNYDVLGRRVHYNVNLQGQEFAGYDANWQKAFKMKENQLQLYFNSSLNYARSPAVINGDEVLQKNLSSYNWLSLAYTFKSKVTFSASQSLSTGITRQEGNVNYSYKNYTTTAGSSVEWPKGLYWNTNIRFNKSISIYSDPINFAIWNASLAYKFLKKENAEIKFSALDLLGQNKSIINYGYNNSVSTGTVNVLQQYFMFTLAYYPRFFGSTEKKK